ncbi:NTP transferase domain-containing protein [Cohnella silvisoli]|uniref:Probable molybdenum cofactor guanylyltransferase n=1 Tax=Cohnella silvisoli TaxID=2873699 RepID=A0ABV1KU80_9BACL|nr:gephyrin-like molybdotransferase Glp [Cohnella silvisoli]MCD9023157.1 NTP transferase domain-containing protein [Cohnella silvisoli]
MALTAVILAGGQGRRMGGVNKALLPLGDEVFIERQIRKALPGTNEIIVVSNDEALNRFLRDYESVRIIADQYPGEGPLAGFQAGMAAASCADVWVIGCDQPFLEVSAAHFLLDRMESGAFQAALPVIGGKPQPLHAIYRKETGLIAESLLKKGERKLLALLDNIPWYGVDERQFAEQGISLNFADDVDTPEQYAKASLTLKGVTSFMPHTDRSDRFRRHALQPEEAQRLIKEKVRPLATERVPLADAWGRRLGDNIVAPHPFPPFRRSGMDGYALRTEDLLQATSEAPVSLTVIESLPCGVEPRHPLNAGQATRIMTGGMVPEGADVVVMLEMTVTEDRDGQSFVQIGKSVPVGLNIAEIGCEIQVGEALLPAGKVISSGETALLAACGYADVPVMRRPRVAVLSTGSELLEVGEPLVPAKIRNSNAPMLASLLREAGAEPVMLGKVPDDASEAQQRIRQALRTCDLLITSGGVSVGDYDVMVDVLAAPDVKLLFNKIAMRPGSPTTAALLDGKLIVALSGNPGACFVGFHLFVSPALQKMQQEKPLSPQSFKAFLGRDFPKINAYRRYIRARTELREGTVWVLPIGDDKSSLMTTIVDADCLIEIPPLKEGLERGHLVTAWKLS